MSMPRRLTSEGQVAVYRTGWEGSARRIFWEGEIQVYDPIGQPCLLTPERSKQISRRLTGRLTILPVERSGA